MDLDFFQTGIVHWPQGDGRPDVSDYPPWSHEQVEEFLESSCGLDQHRPLPGGLVDTHDTVFHCWNRQIDAGTLSAPFDVVHIDAHADLSMGSAGWSHVCFDLLHKPPLHRASAAGELVCEADFLLFAIACRWVRRVTYVYHPAARLQDDLPTDLIGVLFKGCDRTSGVIELPCFNAEDRCRGVTDGRIPPIRREPPVLFSAVPHDSFAAKGDFDFAYLSMSPRYTAPAADDLLDVFRRYIRFEGLSDCLASTRRSSPSTTR